MPVFAPAIPLGDGRSGPPLAKIPGLERKRLARHHRSVPRTGPQRICPNALRGTFEVLERRSALLGPSHRNAGPPKSYRHVGEYPMTLPTVVPRVAWVECCDRHAERPHPPSWGQICEATAVITLVWIAGILLLVVVIPLGSALRVRLTASEEGVGFELRWLLVTVAVDTRARELRLALLSTTILTRNTASGDKRPNKGAKADASSKRGRNRGRVSPARVLAERHAALELVRYLWRHLRWQRFRVRLRVATPDPALTGEVYGYLSALIGAAEAYLPAGSLEVTPDFESRAPGAEADIAVSLRVLVLVVLAWRVIRLRQRLVSPV